jgi:hypothetical protein
LHYTAWKKASSQIRHAYPPIEAMKSRNWFPLDLAALLFLPIIALGVMLLMERISPIINWLRHPTAFAWLWALGIVTGTSILGTLLLFLAKLPEYRVGIFFRVGCHHLPPPQQRLYRVSFWLIVPSIIVLLVLLSAAYRFQ